MSITRREWMTAAGLLTLGGLLGRFDRSARADEPKQDDKPAADKKPRKRSIRLAHLTDVHVQPELHANEGLAACLKHLAAQNDKPQLVLTGGDHVMDSFEQDEPRTKLQWEIWTKTLKDECGLPVRSTLGNHDVWGWKKGKSKTTGDEPRWGKKWACETLGFERPYYSYDKAGWHFIHLDSIFPENDGYVARLDDEQMAWLRDDLKKTDAKTPTLIISHIPIVTICPALIGKDETDVKDIKVSGSQMHRDSKQLCKLFLEHPNVKVCLSGHLHLNERIDYNGVSYLCNGAVCGNWWKGKREQTDNGYALVDLYDDGTFENTYVTYGWEAKA